MKDISMKSKKSDIFEIPDDLPKHADPMKLLSPQVAVTTAYVLYEWALDLSDVEAALLGIVVFGAVVLRSYRWHSQSKFLRHKRVLISHKN
jgi:hypothetical protein